ncbi:MAG: hypothetical protein COV44_07265 [Deltaproteobacteria bacterium CG11_big_fil_rev_8_21_14_0_20_45_16]|nr:MAG: hypothetical protein COV44_07265 [Deltaproteobacteria bacterium CG11_big_fil_rev_8_21_14_0_20_45_16]
MPSQSTSSSTLVELGPWLEAKADLARREGKYDQAIEFWRKILRHRSHTSKDEPEVLGRIHFELGRLQLNRQDRLKALFHLRQSIIISPRNAESLELLARCFLMGNYYRSAKHYYLRALAIQPERSQTWRQLSYCYLKLGKFNEALEASLRSIRFNRKSEDNLFVYFCVLLELSDWDKISSLLKYWRTWRPNSQFLILADKQYNRRKKLCLRFAVWASFRTHLIKSKTKLGSLDKLRRARDLWRDFCRQETRMNSKRFNMRLVRIWTGALDYASQSSEMNNEDLAIVATNLNVESHEIQAAAKLLLEVREPRENRSTQN